MKSLILKVLLPLALLAGVVVGSTWYWIFHTTGGASFVVGQAAPYVADRLEFSEFQGDLSSGLNLAGIQLESADTVISIDRLILAAQLKLSPLHIQIHQLHAQNVNILLAETGSESPTDISEILESLSLPLEVLFQDVQISQLQWGEAEAEQLELIRTAGRWKETLALDSLDIKATDWHIQSRLSMELSKPFPIRLNADAKAGIGSELQLSMMASGDLERLTVQFNSDQPKAQVQGILSALLDDPQAELRFDIPELLLPLDAENQGLQLSALSGEIAGDLDRYQINAVSKAYSESTGEVMLKLSGTGDSEQLEVESLAVNGDLLDAIVHGEVQWTPELKAEVTANVNRLEAPAPFSESTGTSSLQGDFHGLYSEQFIEVESLQLALPTGEKLLQGSGRIDLETETINGRMQWHDLHWPLQAATPDFASETGDFLLSGSLDQWTLEGKAQISSLQADFRGNAALAMNASGSIEPFALQVNLTELSGQFRNRDLEATGAFKMADDQWWLEDLSVLLGKSSLIANGNPLTDEGISLQLRSPDLSRLHPDLTGAANGQLLVAQWAQSPMIRVELQAQDIGWQSLLVSSLSTNPTEKGGHQLSAEGILWGEQGLERVQLDMPAPPIGRSLQLEIIDKGVKLSAALSNGEIHWIDKAIDGWSGQLTALSLSQDDDLNINLVDSAELQVGSAGGSLGAMCMSGSSSAAFCTQGTWSSQGAVDWSAEISSVPLELISAIAGSDLNFTQNISGNMQLQAQPEQPISGQAVMNISPGTVRIGDDEDLVLKTGKGSLGLDLEGGQLRSGRVDIAFADNGVLDIDFSMDDLLKGIDSPIQSRIRVELQDIGSIWQLTPFFSTIDGALNVNATLGGTLAAPRFTGNLSLTDALFEHYASGLLLEDINLEGPLNPKQSTVISGDFRAGDGKGQLVLGLDLSELDNPRARLAVVGEDLQLIDVPNLQIDANPDVSAEFEGGELTINGSVLIPRARIAPAMIPRTISVESKDVVVVAGTKPGAVEEPQEKSVIALAGELVLELGRDVTIELEFADLSMTGKSTFRWNGPALPVADGTFNLEGDVVAYGQNLTISRGRISFPNIPADNPHLNIRAERQIYGNSQVRRAGLMVAGTVRRPVMEAFTVPETNKHRAQTLLVTGSDFDYDKGVGAVDIGTYVTPRLYVSYGIGVFEEGNVVSARYDISSGFGVKATSGQKETGVDISYTIER